MTNPSLSRLLVWIFHILVAVWAFLVMPPMVVQTFGKGGQPHGEMSRGAYVATMFLAPALTSLLMTFMLRFVKNMPPSSLNVPNPQYWRRPENFPIACRKVQAWGGTFGSLIILFFDLLNIQIVRANFRTPPNLPDSDVLVAVGAFVVLLLISIVRLTRSFRLPA